MCQALCGLCPFMTTPTPRPALCGRRSVMTTPTPRPPHILLLLLLLLLCQRAVGIRCVQCMSEEAGDGGSACISQPPEPAPCDHSMTVCMTIRTYTPAGDDKRTLVSLVRTCSPTDMGWDCEKGKTEQGLIAEVCHHTCDWDGCNHAQAITPTLELLAVVGGLWATFLL